MFIAYVYRERTRENEREIERERERENSNPPVTRLPEIRERTKLI